MKVQTFTKLFVFSAVLAIAAVGCKKKPGFVTPLPPGMTKGSSPQDADRAGSIGSEPKPGEAGFTGAPISDPNLRKDWPRNREIFKNDTVHFDYDSAVVKAGDKSKVSAVADYLKSNAQDAVEIEGHADERGTEEYNRALGERRALALRDELIKLGVDGSRVDTTTFGKDRPADTGHDEAAHRKNRRGEFVLETHPK